MARGGICKNRGEMHCFAIRIKQNLCRQSKHQYSLDLLKHILSTLDSAEDMQTFCIGQWPPNQCESVLVGEKQLRCPKRSRKHKKCALKDFSSSLICYNCCQLTKYHLPEKYLLEGNFHFQRKKFVLVGGANNFFLNGVGGFGIGKK